MTPMEVFVAQSNAVGLPRLFGIALALAADALYEGIAAPLLHRGMRGEHLGLDAKPLSVTRIAWRASNIANEARSTLNRWAIHFARYNG